MLPSKIVKFKVQPKGTPKVIGNSTNVSIGMTTWVPERPARRGSRNFLSSSLYLPTFVHILVGPTKTDFAIHRNLICQLSRFFNAAFNGSFSEASSGITELCEEDSDLFEVFYEWCYMKDSAEYDKGQNIVWGRKQVVGLWLFGDKYDVPELCNHAINQLIKYYDDDHPLFTNVAQIYEATQPGSALRRVVIATYQNDPYQVCQYMETRGETFLECPEFLLDLTKALSETLDEHLDGDHPKRHEIPNRHQYHHHKTNKECI